MQFTHDPLFSVLAIVLVVAVPLCLGAYLLARQYRLHRERQWLHEETMTALSKGIAVDLPGRETMTTETITPDDVSRHSSLRLEFGTNLPVELFWMRALSVFFGTLGLFVGGGVLVAFIISEDENTRQLWSMGLIPISGGVGMLVLYAVLTYGFKTERQQGTKSEELD
jgi:hypothetical protein